MIHMISGATRIGSRIVTPSDPPFDATPEIEARLVRSGNAEYVCDTPVATPVESLPDMRECETMGEEENGAKVACAPCLDPEQLKELTNAMLRKLAEDMEIDCTKLRTKAQLIAAICNAPLEDCIEESPEEAEDEACDDGEAPPELDAEEPVL